MSDALKRVLDLVAPRGDGLKKSGSGWLARCPAHEDRQASLSIGEGQAGRVLLKCHAGCDHKAILAAIGLEERELFAVDATRPAATTKPACRAYETVGAARQAYERTLGKPTASWEYKLDGELVGVVLRWDRPDGKKEIRPLSLRAGRWRLEHMADPRPLYGLDQWPMKVRDRVYVVEGEQCVDATRGLGLMATTSSGGSNAASKSDWSPLAGRDVVILPDADEPGRKYADEVAGSLLALDPPAIVRIVELDGLRPGGDVADLREACQDADELQALRDRVERLADEAEPLRTVAVPSSSPAKNLPAVAFQPFPTHELPEPLAAFVRETADAIFSDESRLALPLLAVVGSAIGTTRRLTLKRGWHVPPIIWAVVVGESGTQKSPALDAVLEFVNARESDFRREHAAAMDEHDADLTLYEAAQAAWRKQAASGKADDEPPSKPPAPAARRCMVTDATVEALAPILADNPRGLLLARDELAGWIGGMDRYANKAAASDEPFYLSAYNAAQLIVDRKTSRESIYVGQAALAITGCIQPAVLRQCITARHRASGLLARILLAAPPRRPRRWSEAEVSPLVRERLRILLERLYALEGEIDEHGRHQPRLVRLSDEAKRLWIEHFESHDEETADLSGDDAAAWSKLEETPARLALIFHMAKVAAFDPLSGDDEPDADVVDAETMAAATRVVSWFKSETRRVYQMLDESAADEAARQEDERLAAWIERRGGRVATRDLISGCRGIATADAAEVALNRLEQAGMGRWQTIPPGEHGGRPGTLFVLNRSTASAEPTDSREKTGSACADTHGEPEFVEI